MVGVGLVLEMSVLAGLAAEMEVAEAQAACLQGG